jgi:hypothetical protein
MKLNVAPAGDFRIGSNRGHRCVALSDETGQQQPEHALLGVARQSKWWLRNGTWGSAAVRPLIVAVRIDANPDSVKVHRRWDHVRWTIVVRGAASHRQIRVAFVSRLGLDIGGDRTPVKAWRADDQSYKCQRYQRCRIQ